MEVGRKESGAVSWTHEREAKLHCLFFEIFFETFFLKFSPPTTLSFFCRAPWDGLRNFLACFSFFVFVRCFFFAVYFEKTLL